MSPTHKFHLSGIFNGTCADSSCAVNQVCYDDLINNKYRCLDPSEIAKMRNILRSIQEGDFNEQSLSSTARELLSLILHNMLGRNDTTTDVIGFPMGAVFMSCRKGSVWGCNRLFPTQYNSVFGLPGFAVSVTSQRFLFTLHLFIVIVVVFELYLSPDS